MVTTYLQTLFGEDRCMQFRVIVVTDPQAHIQTHTHTHTHTHTERERERERERDDYNTLRRS